MLLNIHPTLLFSGPLSTSSSYQVAKTFATSKGMVLKINSAYPKLNCCKAFDASLIRYGFYLLTKPKICSEFFEILSAN